MKNIFFLTLFLLFSCEPEKIELDTIAEAYVKLTLELGQYDKDLVDAYYGPEAWKKSIETKRKTFPNYVFESKVRLILSKLEESEFYLKGDDEKFRYNFLEKQLLALKTRIAVLAGKNIKFDDEARLIYDAIVPHFSKNYYDSLLNSLDKILPGKGEISSRFKNYKSNFIIPKDKLDSVFKLAIAEARKETKKYIALPPDETFSFEFVTNKAWSEYNWYQGNFHSLIQINIDLPIFVERALDLAAHEAYPGHHIFNSLIEWNLVKTGNWVEFSIYPLFSPQSLIAEGSANYGINLVFPKGKRIVFLKEKLFPLLGFDSKKVEEYENILELTKKLNYAENEAAQNYLDGNWTKEETLKWLEKYSLMSSNKARQRLDFIEKYRSYVIHYNLGKDIISNYIERKMKNSTDENMRWNIFKEFLSRPKTASFPE